MNAFSYFTAKNEPRIGVQTEEGNFNFTYIWQIFKELKGFRQAPDLQFLQMMVELDYFLIDTFVEVIDTVKEYRTLRDLRVSDDIRYDVPISRPQKIICLGRNYKKHAEELGNVVPEEPIIFSKLPSSLLAHKRPIILPKDIGRVDHEIELAVVIGKAGYRIGEGRAMDYIAGYTIANDVTAREMQAEHIEKKRPWTMSKSMDTFCPMGPYLVPRDAIADPHALDLELRVNGEIRQKASTCSMIFKIPKLISFISKYITLTPGDIICTGTPEGILPIQAGDVIEAEVENLGVLQNRVAAE
jgi:2-keto-4-pentenoate hydratase/2-oxohepta-3-ene-1,7-dioic acid hydratase in catechol pathway